MFKLQMKQTYTGQLWLQIFRPRLSTVSLTQSHCQFLDSCHAHGKGEHLVPQVQDVALQVCRTGREVAVNKKHTSLSGQPQTDDDGCRFNTSLKLRRIPPCTACELPSRRGTASSSPWGAAAGLPQ